MAGILGSVRALGLVAIVAVMFSGVAKADNPCYKDCFKDCSTDIMCMYNPQCIATCGITCSFQDTCKHGSRKVLRNSAKAVAIHSDITEKNSVGGNPCYGECVQDCLNICGLSPFGCAACPAICGTHNTCKDVKNVEINSAKPEETVKIQNDAIEKHSVGALEGNPCYAECVQDCLNTCSWPFCAACPAICGTHNTCKHKKTIEINSGKEAVAIRSDTIQKNAVRVVGGNPCYGECVQECLNNCGWNPVGCAACPAICGTHNTCKDVKKVEIDSAKPEEAVAILSDITEKNSVGGNPCYGECVQDCLNNCGWNPVGCAACPAICGTHNTCKDVKKVEIDSAKPEEAVAILSDITEKNSVGGNPCYGECVQDCLNNCGWNPVGCAACPTICGTHNTCKDVKKLEINSGKVEDVAKSHVGVEERNILRLNTVADE